MVESGPLTPSHTRASSGRRLRQARATRRRRGGALSVRPTSGRTGCGNHLPADRTGKGLYGLFRHGPLPGPRNLEEAARLLLTASESSLTLEAIEFCLKKLSYRFTSASLYNAINRSPTIEWNWHDGHFRVPPATQRDSHLLRDIPVLPHKNRDQWAAVKDLIAAGVETALEERATRLRDVNRRRVMNIDWD